MTGQAPDPGHERNDQGPRSGNGSLHPIDLLLDLAAVVFLLPDAIRRGEWLDSYLLSAAANQIIEDGLAGSRKPGGRMWWRRVAQELERSRDFRNLGAATRRAVTLADRLLELAPRHRTIASLHEEVSALTDALAAVVIDPGADVDPAALQMWARSVLFRSERLPIGLLRQALRLPSSFRSFDQHPADVARAVELFASRWPKLSTPVITVGVRTSGSYLAPLASAALRRRGYRQVRSVTLRPLTTPGPRSRKLLAQAAAEGWLAVVLDDPPASGRSLRQVTDALESFGIPPESIVLMLALPMETAELPGILRRYPSVVLRWSEWRVHSALSEEAVAGALADLLPEGMEVRSVRRRNPAVPPGRKHVRAFFVADVADKDTGTDHSLDFVVEGAGMGFFGRHSVTLADILGSSVPRVYGFRDGLVYREWVHGPTPCESMSEPGVYGKIADYSARRHETLTVGRDRSLDLAGEQPVWEVASTILSPPFGKARLALRPFLVEPLVRRLLTVSQPSIVDGRMECDRWHLTDMDRLLKIDFADGAFSHMDLACYDAVFDLAGAAVEMEREPDGSAALTRLRHRFQDTTGLRVDQERWLIYQLVHLWNDERSGRRGHEDAETARARALQRYFADLYLSDLPDPAGGPICVIDLDGVLENSTLGFSSTTESGALALRALRAHGYRTVIASGRSLGEIVDRCRTLDLHGGVAEYGSAVYDHRTGTVVELTSPEDLEAVEQARAAAEMLPEVEVDRRFQYIVRVRTVRPGSRQSISPVALAGVTSPPSGPWQFIIGEGQTDMVPSNIDKGRGLAQLVDRLAGGSPGTPDIALAVGDTASDISMLLMARMAFGPAHSDRSLTRAGIPMVPHSYQRGLLDAVAALIGHAPGTCGTCAPPPASTERRLLLDLLSVQEDGLRGMPARAGRLALGLILGDVA